MVFNVVERHVITQSQTGEKEENFTINGTVQSSYRSSLIRHWGQRCLPLITKDHVWLKFFLQVHFGFISFRENFLSTNLGERKIRIILAGILEVELGRESGRASLWLWNFQQSRTFCLHLLSPLPSLSASPCTWVTKDGCYPTPELKVPHFQRLARTGQHQCFHDCERGNMSGEACVSYQLVVQSVMTGRGVT